MISYIQSIIFSLISLVVIQTETSKTLTEDADYYSKEVCLNQEEAALFDELNRYRLENGLPIIALSYSLTQVAQLHCRDLARHEPHKKKNCNLHSWTQNGPWSACCYSSDHKRAACMWNKPRELTLYPAEGYEIAFYSSFPYNNPHDYAMDAISNWSQSHGHNNVMINRLNWENLQWMAMGVGFYQGYSTIWLGTVPDPDTREISKCR
ncbi:MAG: hypothetical protein U1C46_09925 [Bacteroidales bacterium]|nr:hypothetical protein [Bacteroidales bacterium]MDZ4205119.1 hypothetical protein [Bacteroidales bacterium]